MNRVHRLILTIVTIGAAVIGTSLVTTPSASATDGYNTNWSWQGGISWAGYYNELVFTKSVSEGMKNHMVAGETIAAVATWACSKVPSAWAEIACVAWITYNGATTRQAVNDAHANGNHCFGIRWYSTDAANAIASHAASVTCNFNVQCCYEAGGGGGGGGGGGSWKSTVARETLVTTSKATAISIDGGSGGGSW